MAPFEMLYGRKCRTLLMLSEVGGRSFFGPALIQEAEDRVAAVRETLRQKGYADKHRRDLSFEQGDYVYLKVSPL